MVGRARRPGARGHSDLPGGWRNPSASDRREGRAGRIGWVAEFGRAICHRSAGATVRAVSRYDVSGQFVALRPAELIEAMEAEIVVLRRENAVLRAAGDDIRAVLSRATEAVEIAIKP